MKIKKFFLSALALITAFSITLPICAADQSVLFNEVESDTSADILLQESDSLASSDETADTESVDDVSGSNGAEALETSDSETTPEDSEETESQLSGIEGAEEAEESETSQENGLLSPSSSANEAFSTDTITSGSFSGDFASLAAEAEKICDAIRQNTPQTLSLSPDETLYLRLEMLTYVNLIRAQNGYESLAMYDALNQAALLRSKEIQTVFDHTRPDGTSCITAIEQYGIPYMTAGENIAWGQPDVPSVLQTWWNSPGHQANMLNPYFQLLGPGVSENNGTYYWVQLFTGGYTMTSMELYAPEYFQAGTAFQDTGSLLYVTYSNGITAYLPVLDYMVEGYDPDQEGTQTIKLHCQGYSGEFNIKVRDSVKEFVSRLYTEILGRDPDPSGLEAWTNVLKNRTEQGAKVAQGFVDSTEFKKRQLSDEEYITILYHTFLDREPDSSGMNAWKAVLDSGLSRLHVFKGFAESVEFTEICESYGITRGNVVLTAPMDQNEGVTKFVVRCYRLCLGREADTDGLNAWCNQILTGQNTAKEAAHGFVFSDEFKKKNLSDEEYIRTLYRVFMDREADGDGLNAWLKVLRNGQSREHVFNGFADSNEFKEICAEYGIK